ncbi:hypothetical protein ASPWEDRAFT_44901 [Aspergillus wentii DTO 134E9]|uniref:ASST-domain-containing protein n=1 Tax=Aspergillus wentii DTO 134E9 TaxID=1073089 RepID=A0A1L9R7T5_ASPWE|nr:uncharacterized protein ASPWEDRAFT_44901 [Aspergillus wentii DTO 134E9]KAI9927573.1 hypothetical protein MW887_003191 [Aspergillus wentii]OJJ30948.1 hypothetical protein ASPWEDRAFT_44901 [Aspergillus wentii DTO 134E9]
MFIINQSQLWYYISEILLAVIFLSGLGIAETANWTSFQSRPDIHAPILNINVNNDALTSKGYIFLAPFFIDKPGPFIFDTSGNLVWSGVTSPTPNITHNLHVCNYRDEDHLCYFQGIAAISYALGKTFILDSNYELQTSVQSGNGLTESDLHESKVVDGDSMLITIYQPRQYNLEAYGIPDGSGWVMDGVFQEINITDGSVLFEWRSLDHVALSETYTPLNQSIAVGNGLNETTPWDYFHLNSVDKNAQGDYLISARHTSCIYKISGQDGAVMWRLGGKQSSIQQKNFNFSYQHDARYREENETTTIISLFDNAAIEGASTALTSSAMVVTIDHPTNSSAMIRQYLPPDNLLSKSQANAQLLDSKNMFVGWGDNPVITEYVENGTLVYHAQLTQEDANNYRAFKHKWTGTPREPPALATHAPTVNSPTIFWVSWNGATEVQSYRFYGTSSASDQFAFLTEVNQQGFQTTYTSPAYHPLAYAEAIGRDGVSLGNSSVVTISSSVPGKLQG